MRSRLLRVAALIVSTTALCGCFENDTVLLVRQDGSGTLSETTLFSAQMIEMMAGAAGAMAPPGQEAPKVDPLKQMIEEEALAAKAAKLGEGVTVKSAKVVRKDDGRAGHEIVYAVKDVRKLKLLLSQKPAGGAGGGPMGPGRSKPKKEKEEFATLKFVKPARGRPARLTIIMPKPKQAAPDEKPPAEKPAQPKMPPEMEAQMKAMMKSMMGDMRMRLTIRT